MLEGKVVLLNGSASWDIGSAVALTLAKNGADIVLNQTSINQTAELESRLSELCETIREMGRQSILLNTPTADAEAVKHMIQEISSKYHSVDILINNASGLTIADIVKARTAYQDKLKMSIKEIYCATNCTVECIPLMRDNRWGRIINIGLSSVLIFMRKAREMSSMAGSALLREIERHVDFPRAHLFSKSEQVLHFHEQILDLRQYDITINSVELGDDHVEHWDHVYGVSDGFQRALSIQNESSKQALGTYYTPQDIANAVLFLCSDRARFMTDTEIRFSSK